MSSVGGPIVVVVIVVTAALLALLTGTFGLGLPFAVVALMSERLRSSRASSFCAAETAAGDPPRKRPPGQRATSDGRRLA